MSSLKFDNYIIDTIEFKNNPNYIHDKEQVEVVPEFKAEISREENKAAVNLMVNINEKLENPIFTVSVSIVGFFEFVDVENESAVYSFDQLLKINAIAILYPYLRSVVSDITGKSNIYPNYNLPIINVVEKLKEENGIKFL